MKAAAAFAIVNFVWQGAVVGALAWFGFALSRSPRIRYLVGIAALAVMAAAPVITGAVIARAVEVPGPLSPVPGSRPSRVLGATSGRLDPGRGTEDVREPGTGDEGRWTFASLPLLDARVASTILAGWLIGVVALSTRFVFSWLGVRAMTRRVVAAGASVQALADQLAVKLRIRATVRIVESALVKVPSVIGAFKPVVLLPAAAMSGLSMEQVEALLAHELAHVRRHDYLVNLFQSAIETLLFYHPAVWLVSRRVRQERELCCDDLALEVCSDRVAYASALADLETLRAMPSPALAANGGSLLARIRRILGNDEFNALAGRSQGVAGIAILASIMLVAGGQAARARAADSGRAGWSPTPPQTSPARNPTEGVGAVQGGVQGGLSGGVQGGVIGGVKPGVSAGVSGGKQGGVSNDVPGSRVLSPQETLIVDAENDDTLLEIGNTVLVWVSSPINQSEFSDRSYTIDANGNIALPHVYGHVKLAGLNVGGARALIKKTLTDQGQYANPQIQMSIVRGPAEAPAQMAPAAPAIGPFRVGDNIRIDIGDPGSSDSFKLFTTIQPDGMVAGGTAQPQWAFSVTNLKAAGETSTTIAAVIADRYRTRGLAVPSIDVTFDDRSGTNVSRFERRAEQAQPAAAVAAQPTAVSVVIQGAVRMPGSLQLRADHAAITDAISSAGGFQTAVGSRVWVHGGPNRPKPGPQSQVDEIGEVFRKEDLLQGRVANARVYDGDTIIVEVAPTFGVSGFVKKPGQYSWEPGMTVEKALALAGGLTPQSGPNRIKIRRKDPQTGGLVDIKIDKLDMEVQPGDVIVVPERYF